MKLRPGSLVAPALSLVPFALFATKQDPPQQLKCEDVYANIHVFKGIPAEELIPAMEFMAASMQWECKDCHDATDFSKETHAIETTRQMILMQRDINEKWFNGRLEVTCATCHRAEEHPPNVPLPTGVALRHARVTSAPRPPELFAKHLAAAGTAPVMIERTGTLTAKSDETGEVETKDLTLTQAQGGKFKLVSGARTIVGDGTQVTYGGALLWGEPVVIFQRIARTWWGEGAFAGLDGLAISGKDKVGTADVLVARGRRGTTSTEDLYFDTASGLLQRLVNNRRSNLGSVITVIDYLDYKMVDGTNVPMKIVITFATNEQWVMDFKAAKKSTQVDESLFKIGQPD